MEPRIHLVEVIIAIYALLVSALVVLFRQRMEYWWVYLIYHALVLGMMGLIYAGHTRFGGRFWKAMRYWVPLVVILASFRELNFILAPIHPFEPGYAWDHFLRTIDTRLLGVDLESLLVSVTWRPLADFFSVCYWMYFPMPLILALAMYRAGDDRRLRYVIAGLFLAWYISYIGYMFVPAVGPHRMLPRDPALDGMLIAGISHDMVRGGEWDMPNAFPSGHALVTLMTLTYAFLFQRRVFRMILPFGIGLIVATVYLRYHYLADVLASVLLFPVVLWLAKKLFVAWEGREAPDVIPTGF